MAIPRDPIGTIEADIISHKGYDQVGFATLRCNSFYLRAMIKTEVAETDEDVSFTGKAEEESSSSRD